MFVLSIAIIAPLEIPGHDVMLPIWPHSHRKEEENTHAEHSANSYFVSPRAAALQS